MAFLFELRMVIGMIHFSLIAEFNLFLRLSHQGLQFLELGHNSLSLYCRVDRLVGIALSLTVLLELMDWKSGNR